MAKSLQTRFGKIKKLGWNPRNITSVAFTNLCESLYRDPDFMVARPIIIDENNDILGGNQRYTALQTIFEDLKSEDPKDECWQIVKSGKIPDSWVQQVTGWSDDKKKRFNLIDNSPAGIAGTFDYEILKNEFGLNILADSGIDFSNLGTDAEGMEDFSKTAEQSAEESEMGEDNERNQQFVDAREEARNRGEDATDVSFVLTFVFQSTEQKKDFVQKVGLVTQYDLFANGLELARKMGVELIEAPKNVFRPRKAEKELSEMAMAISGDDASEESQSDGSEEEPKEN